MKWLRTLLKNTPTSAHKNLWSNIFIKERYVSHAYAFNYISVVYQFEYGSIRIQLNSFVNIKVLYVVELLLGFLVYKTLFSMSSYFH